MYYLDLGEFQHYQINFIKLTNYEISIEFFFFEKVSIEFMFKINKSPYNIKCTKINTIKQFIYRVNSRRMNSI